MSSTLVRSLDSRTPDPICAAAVDLALAAALADVGPEAVGAHCRVIAEDDRLVSHRFTCTLPGYPGWEWQVTVARASRSRKVTVDEVSLVPSAGSLQPPAWVPWSQRLQPGDLTPGTVVPTDAEDPRLASGNSAADDLVGQLDDAPLHPVNWEPFLQRRRVPSAYGRETAATRWYHGATGPQTGSAKSAPAPCGSCGWMLLIGGPLGQAFGVCTNRLSDADGKVVSFEYGCGAHSEALPRIVRSSRVQSALDDLAVDEFDLGHS